MLAVVFYTEHDLIYSRQIYNNYMARIPIKFIFEQSFWRTSNTGCNMSHPVDDDKCITKELF